MIFKNDFLWGVAAASFQNEGASFADGKGPSIWDMMARWPGKIWNGDSPDPACDQYHRYEEDVRIMGEMGVQVYRMSIAWPRVIPEGVGPVNSKGFDYYDRLIDCLLAHNIQPWVSLYHWDYPYALHLRGGWLNPDSSNWFADYTTQVVNRYSDRVVFWETINEPQVFIGAGYRDGGNPPGLKLGNAEILRIAHNVLLSHGKAVQVIRACAKKTPRITAVLVGFTAIPASDNPADIQAARDYMFRLDEKRLKNTWMADPIYLGHYPEDGVRANGEDMPPIHPGDMETIHQPLDHFGVNIYAGEVVKAVEGGGYVVLPSSLGPALTALEWNVTPQALYWGPRLFYERYHVPIYITENGMAGTDWVHLDGRVHDPQRIDFLQRYLQELARAVQDGTDVGGYFVWTFSDNFEASLGYKSRFGLVFIDYRTQKRIWKDSAFWYQKVIQTKGDALFRVG